MMEIEWRAVPGFEGLYEVSNLGGLRNLKTGKLLSTKGGAGAKYVQISLSRNGESIRSSVHRWVALAFHGPAEGREVNHKDGNGLNNAASNLEWVTHSENVLHAYYTLGHLVNPVIATSVATGEEIHFRSVELAVKAGFNSGHIYRSLNAPHKIVSGHKFRRAPRPQRIKMEQK